MKTITTAAVLAVAFTGMFTGAARAQDRVVATVPFPFVVHGQELPAGHYDITTEDGVLSIRGTDNSLRMIALTQPADGRDPVGDQPVLVFIRYENQNLLSQIWESEADGVALPDRAITPRRDRAEPPHESLLVLPSGVEVSGK
jgi:hypothetical protein